MLREAEGSKHSDVLDETSGVLRAFPGLEALAESRPKDVARTKLHRGSLRRGCVRPDGEGADREYAVF